jgi:hypothetical protein
MPLIIVEKRYLSGIYKSLHAGEISNPSFEFSSAQL